MGHNHKKNKYKSKHKKEKSKRKKDKKLKKVKTNIKSEYKMSLGSSSSSSSFETDVNESSTSDLKQQKWNFLESALSQTNAFHRQKKLPDAKKSNIYEPRTNPKELNPYWQSNGTGLPPTLTGKKLSNNFIKPGDNTPHVENLILKNQHSNWRKKEFVQLDNKNFDNKNLTYDKSTQKINVKTIDKSMPKIITDDELNSLGAKLIKAEILGNKILADKLKAELESAKNARESQKLVSTSPIKCSETNAETSSIKHKRQYKETIPSKKLKLKEEEKFLLENSKYSLQNMFLMAKKEINDELSVPELNVKYIEGLDDDCNEIVFSKKSAEKIKNKKKTKILQNVMKKHKSFEGCSWCLNNRNDKKHLIISIGTKCYLSLPDVKSLTEGHCFIIPLQHEVSTIKLDEDVQNEIKVYQKLLTEMFSEMGRHTVFFECARSFKHYPHCFIQCISLDKEQDAMAPIYFQKALLDSETEWSNNKKIIDFKNKDLTKVIPKDLEYFAVSFGIEGGLAHIIEDERLFPKNFAEEIIGGMLDLESDRWRRPKKENFNAQREKALKFLKSWKKYEFNKNNKGSSSSSKSSDSE